MGAATAALSWLRPPATIVRGAPTPGSRRRRRTRLVAATTGGAVGQVRAAANRVGVGIAAHLAGARRWRRRRSRRRRRTRLVAATTGGAVGQVRAAANRVGVGIATDGALAGCVHRQSDPRLRAAQLRQAHLVAAVLGSACPLLCEDCGGADHQSAQHQPAESHGSIDAAKPGLIEADALQRTILPVGLP